MNVKKTEYSIKERKFYYLVYKYESLQSTLLLIILFPAYIIFIASCSPDEEFDYFIKLCESLKINLEQNNKQDKERQVQEENNNQKALQQ